MARRPLVSVAVRPPGPRCERHGGRGCCRGPPPAAHGAGSFVAGAWGLPAAQPRQPRSSSRDGPCLRGCASSTTPPPSVSGGAIWRITSGRPATAISGCSSRSCQKSPPSQASRAGVSRVPWWTWTRAPCSGSSRSARAGVEQIRRSQVRPARPARRRVRPRHRDADEVDRHALTGVRALDRLVVDLDASNSDPPAAGSSRSSSPRPICPTTAFRSPPSRRRGS